MKVKQFKKQGIFIRREIQVRKVDKWTLSLKILKHRATSLYIYSFLYQCYKTLNFPDGQEDLQKFSGPGIDAFV